MARIDSARLSKLLSDINAFGPNPATGGFDRPAFGEADMAVRRWFRETMAAEGLETGMDAAGNVSGRFGPPGRPAVMVGSHLDTVPSGGAFDGALGCAVALECVRALRDAGVAPSRPVEVMATADEEGRFGGMLGSQALAGVLAPGWAERASDAAGVPLAEAMAAAGLDVAALPSAARPAGSVHAFLELHIEQGPVLEAAGRPVGIASAVSGCCVLAVRLEGTANHSGTTPMEMRRDAFLGLARIGDSLAGIVREIGTDQSRVTVGRVALVPNEPHTIAGAAEFTLVVRDVARPVMVALRAAIEALVARTAQEMDLAFAVEERSWLDPVGLDPALQRLLLADAKLLGIEALEMPSGAGHDAQTMAALCPSALVFVPSRGGISHAPEEFSEWADIERGAAVLLATLLRLVTD